MKNDIRLTFLRLNQPTQIVHGFLVDQASFSKKEKATIFYFVNLYLQIPEKS